MFPPVEMASCDGFLAYGGDLSEERLLLAYRSGIFPWPPEEGVLYWFSPDPRFVLFTDRLHVSKTMQSILKKGTFEVTFDQEFRDVIGHCSKISRNGQDGTWITTEIQEAYINLFESGHAHSVEVWQNGNLVGGLYGIRMGRCFFGESMFSLVPNASKAGFITYVNKLKEENCLLVDCQVYTPHLESLGAEMISREYFLKLLEQNLV